ncbi:tetratricopeptide repeat protein [Candidatus Acetothermia bacterium]|nr:tetratricopeptide repeat protein [Candidatus Acetothermia bacterium]
MQPSNYQGPKSPAKTWKRFWVAMAVALSVIAIVLVAVSFGMRFWAAAQKPSLDEAYRYHFERPPVGKTTQDLEREIAFYQERIQRDLTGGLDSAALARAYLKMARASGEIHWYLLAEETAQRSLANLPYNNEGAQLVLARVAEARHDFTAAIHILESIPYNDDALAIKVSSYSAMGKIDEADQAAKALIDASPTLLSYALQALVNLAQGKDDEAIRNFERALSVEEPGETASSVWARTLFGRLYAKHGRLELAREFYQEALRILPQYQLAIVNLAELELRFQQYDAAWTHFSQIFVIARGNPTIYDHTALRGMARIKLLRGDTAGASELWDKAEAVMRRDIKNFGHRRELARLLLERGRPEDLSEALSLMEEEIKIRRDAETLDTYAWVLSRAGRSGEAQQAMHEALRWGVRDPVLFYRAGLIEKTLKNESQAQAFFKSVSEIDPGFDEHARQALGLGL